MELALKWRDQGRAQRDPYLLRLAMENFELADKPEEAKLCEAEMYEYEGKFGKAAEIFIKCGQRAPACRCYWANKNTAAIIHMVKKFPEVSKDPRFIAASAIERDQNTTYQISAVLTALEKVTPTPFPDMPGEIDAWQWFFNQFVIKTGDAIEASEREKQEWAPYIDRLIKTIARFELPLRDYPEIAKLHFLAGHSVSALDYWNKHCRNLKPDSERDNWLARARAETEPYSNNIRYFYEIKEYKIAIEQWYAAGRIIDSDTPVKPLLDSAISLNDITAIRALLPLNNDLSQLSAALRRIDRSDIHSLIGALPVAIAHSLQFRGNWQQLIKFVASQITPDHELNEIIKQAGIKWAKSELVASAVRIMACSEQLAQNDSKVQKVVSNFLKQYLIIEKEAKRDKQELVKIVLKLIDIIEAGAAFERAYRLTYVLEFYEQFIVKNCLAHRIL